MVFLYTICRVFFYVFNASHFEHATFISFAGGIRFDITAILVMNLPLIIFHLLPFPFRNTPFYQKALGILFIIVNAFALALNCVDIEYFPYSQKRSTVDLFKLLGTGDDMKTLLPQFVKDFWHIGIIVIVLIALMNWLYRKIKVRTSPEKFTFKYFITQFVVMLAGLVFMVILARGGFQIRPLSIPNAAAYPTSDEMQLVLNTPFTIIKTFGKPSLEEKNYFPDEQLNEDFSTRRHYNKEGDFSNKPNVVIFILESFSKEYISSISGKGRR